MVDLRLLRVNAGALWRTARLAQRDSTQQDRTQPLSAPSTRPATASSFFSSAGSRASGAVMSAVSSARSEPIGHGSCSRGKSRASRATRRLRLLGVGGQHLDDVLHRDGVVVGMPAVEIGHHGDGRVANLGFARELGLRHVGHADHRIAELLVGQAFGQRGELRPLHADIGAAAHHRDALGLRRRGEMDAQPRRHRMRHRDMRDAALAEERTLALVGAVDELVDQHEGAGRQLLLERAAGRERDQVGDAGALEHVDIGAVVDVGGRQPVALVVARQEHHRQAGDLADAQRRRRLAPRARDALLAHILEPRQIVDAGAADDAEHGFGHGAHSLDAVAKCEGPHARTRNGALRQDRSTRSRGRARRARPSSW